MMRSAAVALWLLMLRGATAPASASTLQLTIVVVVTDQTGAPIPYAPITIATNPNLIGHYIADAHGVLKITGPGGDTRPFQVCASDDVSGRIFYACNYQVVPPPSGTITVPLTIDLSVTVPSSEQPRGWIAGSVTLAGSHTPIAGASVALASTPLVTTTSSTGSYQFAAVSTTDGQDGGPTYIVTLTPPPGFTVVGPSRQPVTVQAGQGVSANFLLQPSFTPFWVESFVPSVTEWSGPDARAVAFGSRPQWSHVLVVAPQQGLRLEVFDPLTKGYAWVDAASVGPSGPPR